MVGGSGGGNTRELDETPTWAVASVCAVIILISILLEKGIHHLGQWFTERHRKAMFEALEKIKDELMILGFISLLLSFGQNYIIQICIPVKAANTMLPCQKAEKIQMEGGTHHKGNSEGISSRHRMLMEAPPFAHCTKGKVPLISLNGLHQLHIFIFFLAIFHVCYSALTMALGRAKIHGWKEWERDASSLDNELSNDPSRFRFSHETSFVRQHTSIWNRIPFSFYIVNFFRQFFRSVTKADYLVMRHGFITMHLAPGSKFDFQKYIKRSLEDDFKVVVGIRHILVHLTYLFLCPTSPILWASAVFFMLLNVKGWLTLFWISIIPVITILAVGTKLQAIITIMALEITERHTVVQGIPLVQLSDHHFWFGHPKFILFLIHFTLFQNAFQLIYFVWIWYEFGLDSCFHDSPKLMIARICCGIMVQILCSYITLPLYALVSQASFLHLPMGSHMKKSIFDEQTSKALKKWHQFVKKKNLRGLTHTPSRSPNGSSEAASVHPIPHFKPPPANISLSLSPSRRRRHSDAGVLSSLATVAPAPAIVHTDLLTGSTEHRQQHAVKGNKDDEFTFINLSDP
ncbi:MLO-like protein 9 [Canna indica]|uniref:MLO-like protein n=1 Tax=Canna indica TaxID=4628 RepID=A0AAQ3JPP1_9LILI|nr:MLO-like protein 9 [Canna indica]